MKINFGDYLVGPTQPPYGLCGLQSRLQSLYCLLFIIYHSFSYDFLFLLFFYPTAACVQESGPAQAKFRSAHAPKAPPSIDTG